MNKEMNLAELQNIETEEGVSFSLNDAGRISASGARAGVERALARIVLFRNEVAQLLRERQGLPEPGHNHHARGVGRRRAEPGGSARQLRRLVHCASEVFSSERVGA